MPLEKVLRSPKGPLAHTLRTAGIMKVTPTVQININIANPYLMVPKRLKQSNYLNVQNSFCYHSLGDLLGYGSPGAMSEWPNLTRKFHYFKP